MQTRSEVQAALLELAEQLDNEAMRNRSATYERMEAVLKEVGSWSRKTRKMLAAVEERGS